MKLVIALEDGHDGVAVRAKGVQFYVDEARLSDGSTWFEAVEDAKATATDENEEAEVKAKGKK